MRFPAPDILYHSQTRSENRPHADTDSPPLTRAPAICYNSRPRGAVAQLGERLNGIQEVVGSIPIGSTSHEEFEPAAERRRVIFIA